MQSLNQYITEKHLEPVNTYVNEGLFSWLTGLFKRSLNFRKKYKKRFGGKLPTLNIDDVDNLQVAKPLKGTFKPTDLKDVSESGFTLLPQMLKKDDYLKDNDGNDIKNLTTMTYVYTPENSLSKDEKYIAAIGVHGDTELIENYKHIVCFEISNIIKNANNINSGLFKVYVDKYIRDNNKSIEGITIKYINSANDFANLQYDGKKFEEAKQGNKLLKLEF